MEGVPLYMPAHMNILGYVPFSHDIYSGMGIGMSIRRRSYTHDILVKLTGHTGNAL